MARTKKNRDLEIKPLSDEVQSETLLIDEPLEALEEEITDELIDKIEEVETLSDEVEGEIITEETETVLDIKSDEENKDFTKSEEPRIISYVDGGLTFYGLED